MGQVAIEAVQVQYWVQILITQNLLIKLIGAGPNSVGFRGRIQYGKGKDKEKKKEKEN